MRRHKDLEMECTGSPTLRQSGTCAVVIRGVSFNEGAGGRISSCIVDGGGGVSSNQGGGIDGGMATARTAVEFQLVHLVRDKPTACRVLDRPMLVLRLRIGMACICLQLSALAVEFLVVYPGEG